MRDSLCVVVVSRQKLVRPVAFLALKQRASVSVVFSRLPAALQQDHVNVNHQAFNRYRTHKRMHREPINFVSEDVKDPEASVQNLIEKVEGFYKLHTEINVSHGIEHVLAVFRHAVKAIECHRPQLSQKQSMEIQMAALLHDVDDRKYFPHSAKYENAVRFLEDTNVERSSCMEILSMIRLISCSQNGNTVPDNILENGEYFRLIPRWADRLEAVGAIGVVRCYQYNREQDEPLSSSKSPRATTAADVWKYASPARFQDYIRNGRGKSADMISHYYDKLLHVARPPSKSVRNSYLEQAASESCKELVEICISFGKDGTVDEQYIRKLALNFKIEL